MTELQIETRGLDELIARMKHCPGKLKEVSKIGINASLLVLWENVPPYPEANPDSSYRRTGTLGRTLGSSEAGGKSAGSPDIYTVKALGTTEMEGRFGTRLGYSPYVIGENQAWMHKDRWWKLSAIIPKAQGKIVKIWEGIAKLLTDFLDAKSSGLLGK